MKVKMLTSLAGRDYSLSPGDQHDFPQDEADRLIAAGYCEAAKPKGKKTVKRKGKDVETAAQDVKVEKRG
jgi:hypothetical protein